MSIYRNQRTSSALVSVVEYLIDYLNLVPLRLRTHGQRLEEPVPSLSDLWRMTIMDGDN